MQDYQGKSLTWTSEERPEALFVERGMLFSDQRRVLLHFRTSWLSIADPSSSCARHVYVPASHPPPPMPHG
jgi:hypothetical protein